jgi:hypothetical protein
MHKAVYAKMDINAKSLPLTDNHFTIDVVAGARIGIAVFVEFKI